MKMGEIIMISPIFSIFPTSERNGFFLSHNIFFKNRPV